MNKEYLIEKSFQILSIFSIAILCLILCFIILQAIPAFQHYGFFNFLFGNIWNPDESLYGVLPMILSTFYIAILALIIASPLAIGCAVFMEDYASDLLKSILKPVVQTLAGIPSVVYGFFGLTVIVPFIRENFTGQGFSIIAAAIVLSVMILPTIITLTQDAVKSVPAELKEASLALGSTKWQALRHVILPYSLPGIIQAIILGLSRAVGETLAVLMISGNVSQIPDSIFDPVRSLTSNIALEMGYATDIHYNALFASAFVLFLVIIALLFISNYIRSKVVL